MLKKVQKLLWFGLLALVASFPLLAQETPETTNNTGTVSPSPALSTAPAPAAPRRDALAAYRSRQYAEAINITLQEIRTNPSNMDSYAVLGWSLNALRRYQEAIRYAQEGRSRNATDHRMVGILAEANYALGNDSPAIAFFQQYISMTSRIPGYDQRYIRDSYRDLADIFARNKEYHHADIAMTAAILYDTGAAALEPARQADLWYRLGQYRLSAGELAGAKTAFTQALAKNPALQQARQALDGLN